MTRKDVLIAGVATGLTALGIGHEALAAPDATAGSHVEVVRDGERWQLRRNGAPYVVRGAGGNSRLDLLKSLGGNSVRTWGADTAQKDLDAAQALGLTVTVGVWLGHKDNGFRYDDSAAVSAQLESIRKVVRTYRNHPALLAWGVGNEMEGDGNDPLVWAAVQQIAAMVHQEDPNHPVMTVIAEIGGDGSKARAVKDHCPDIDILGINSYGGLASLPDRLKACGWTKPYIVTEFGPNGPWEVGRTSWGAPLEPTSTEKTSTYLTNYLHSIADQAGWCLGSYAFLWGSKVEGTTTWFGMFVPDTGERLGPTDALSFAWTGKWPSGSAPEILALIAPFREKEIAAGSTQTVRCVARTSGDASLSYEYVVRPERADDGAVGKPVTSDTGSATITAPLSSGAYRLYVTVRDSAQKTAATANVPFQVRPA